VDFEPDEDLTLISETARRFANDVLLAQVRSAEANRAVDAAIRKAFDELGFAGLEWPEVAGGAGLGSVARVLLNEELGAVDVGSALALDRLGPALYPMLEMGGNREQLLAWSEGGGRGPRDSSANAGRIVLVSDADGPIRIEGDRVSGIVPWIPASEVAGLVVLVGDQAAFVREGFRIEPIRGAGLRAAGAGALELVDAPIEILLSHAPGAARVRARARLYVASLLLGVMRAACDFSREYAMEREAFGKPIAHHQALAFLIADMQMALDGARLLVREAAWHLDTGLPAEARAASALAECIDASRSIGPNGVQILGGHGFMADYPVEKHMREARALGLLYGGFDAAIEEAGRLLSADDSPLGLVASERVAGGRG
jgi:alkylation response protein AidB-like acyl-CoA dehydrogenase